MEAVASLFPSTSARSGFAVPESPTEETVESGAPAIEHTDAQVEALQHLEGPMQVVAGPGSGKTEVMTRRIARLIREGHASPDEILCITFTNRAADELKDRIRLLVETDVEAMQVSTVHSFCRTLIEDYVDRLPIDRAFRVLDANTQFLYVYNRRHPLNLTFPKSKKGRFLRSVIRFFNDCTEAVVDPDGLVRHYASRLEDAEDADEERILEERLGIAKSYVRYVEHLLEDSVLDFGHLQKLAWELLQDDEVLPEVRNRYRFVQVDEYQDTNPIQAKLFRRIAGEDGNIVVVGDDDQSIYRFRGATVENLLEFDEQFEDPREVKLEDNFRSTETIVGFTSDFIESVSDRLPKSLRSRQEEGNDVLHVQGETVADEAERLARLLWELRDEGHIETWSDVAVLLRSVTYQSEHYLEALEEHGIPYLVEGDRSLFQRENVEGFRRLLLAMVDDGATWPDLLVPVLPLKESTRNELKDQDTLLPGGEDDPEYEMPYIPDFDDEDLIEDLLDLRRRVRDGTYDDVTSVFFELLEITGFLEDCVDADDYEELRNLGRFSEVIFNFDDVARRTTVDQFEWYLRWLGDEAVDAANPPEDDAVQVMTVHQAKGLEFPVVMVPSLLERRFPLSHKQTRYPVPDEFLETNTYVDKATHFDDERRLFYVAATRAEKLLVLGSAEVVNLRGEPSRFVDEFSDEHLRKVEDGLPELVPMDLEGSESGQRTRLSYSHIMYYLYCPLRYRFFTEFDFHVPRLTRVDYGANLHRSLEELHTRIRDGETFTESELADIFERNWIPMGQRARRYEDELKDKGKRMFIDYYDRHGDDLDDIVDVERNFAHLPEDHDAVLAGRMDLLRESNGGVEIIDFKTRQLPDEEELEDRTQLGVYAYAGGPSLDRPVKKLSLYSLPDQQSLSIPWNSEVQDEVEAEIHGVLAGIERKDFAPTPGPDKCGKCEFRNVCPHSEAPGES